MNKINNDLNFNLTTTISYKFNPNHPKEIKKNREKNSLFFNNNIYFFTYGFKVVVSTEFNFSNVFTFFS